MAKKLQVHIGTPEDMGKRFIDAWHRAERGEVVEEEHRTVPERKVRHVKEYSRHSRESGNLFHRRRGAIPIKSLRLIRLKRLRNGLPLSRE